MRARSDRPWSLWKTGAITLAAVALLLVVGVAGCGDDDDPAQVPQEMTTEEATTEETTTEDDDADDDDGADDDNGDDDDRDD